MFDFTAALRLYAKLRQSKLNSLDPEKVQEETLRSLLRRAASTKFGKEYGFESINSVAEYQARVPLRKYDQFWSEWWKPAFPLLDNLCWPGKVKNFVISSGTTSGITKYIPFTPEMIAQNKKAGLDLAVHHLAHRPNSKILGGKTCILLGSSSFIEEAPGVFSGDVSDTMIKNLPWWLKARYFPRGELACIKSWEERIDRLGHAALLEPITSLNGVPSWLLVFFDKLKELRPDCDGKLHRFFPKLEMLAHGGVKFDPYRRLFSEMLEGSNIDLREVYPASEAFIGSQDRGSAEGLRMVLDAGVFFEFVPLEELGSPKPTRHWIKNIEKDINYALVLNTPAGLWSYLIGDTVRFVDTKPPRLLITGRTSYMLSAFGEHVIEEEIQKALDKAATELDMNFIDFSVGAIYPQNSSELGQHLYVIEFQSRSLEDAKIKRFPEVVDEELRRLNDDYQAHRAKGFGMRAPDLLVAPPGAFNAWMRSRGKEGGQNKVPRVINDQELFKGLQEFVRGYH